MFHKALSVGKYGQWIVAVIAALTGLTSGQTYGWPAAALPKIRSGSAGFYLTETQMAIMVTITFVGNVLTPIPSGSLMDMIGRRSTIALSLLVAVVGWLILAFLNDFTSILIARLLSGIFGGIIHTVVPAFLGEVVDPSIRGSVGGLFGTMLFVGALYENLASNTEYQLFILISAIPSMILFIAFLMIPESPYYYLKKGNREEAKASIEWLKGVCNDQDLDILEEKVKEQMEMKGRFIDIFKNPACLKAFIIVEFLYATQRCSGATFLCAYATSVVPPSFVSPANSFMIILIVWIISSFLSSSVIDKFNRRTVLGISCFGSGTAMCAATVWYYLRDFSTIDTSTTNYLPLVFLIISGSFYCIGIVSIPIIIQSELFPVNLKSKGSALACISANIISGLGTQFFYDINENIGMYFNFLIMGVAPLICLVFIFTVMVETKGKSLESIQDMLNGRPTVSDAKNQKKCAL